jgi:hypothetical protein
MEKIRALEARVKDHEADAETWRNNHRRQLQRAEKAEADLAAARDRIAQLATHDVGTHGCNHAYPDWILQERAAGRDSGENEGPRNKVGDRRGSTDQPPSRSTDAAAKPAARPDRDPDDERECLG